MPHCIFLWCSRYPIRPFHKKRATIVCVLLCLLRLSYMLRSTQFYLRCQFITIVNSKPFVYIRAGLNYIFWIEMERELRRKRKMEGNIWSGGLTSGVRQGHTGFWPEYIVLVVLRGQEAQRLWGRLQVSIMQVYLRRGTASSSQFNILIHALFLSWFDRDCES